MFKWLKFLFLGLVTIIFVFFVWMNLTAGSFVPNGSCTVVYSSLEKEKSAYITTVYCPLIKQSLLDKLLLTLGKLDFNK